MSPTQAGASSQTNPHCGGHAYFASGCEQCARARAAFQPYPLRGKAEAPSRSFQNGDSLVISESSLSANDLVKVAATEIVAKSLLNVVLSAFFGI